MNRQIPAGTGGEADAINRDEQLEVLIDRYQNLIFSICYKITADYFAAEDLAQETFLSAYEKYGSFDRGTAAKAVGEKGWLGVMTGGLTATAGGIAAAVFFGLIAALLFRSGDKS